MKHEIMLDCGEVRLKEDSGGMLQIQNDGPGVMVVSFRHTVEVSPGGMVPVLGNVEDIVVSSRGHVSGSVTDGHVNRLSKAKVEGYGKVTGP